MKGRNRSPDHSTGGVGPSPAANTLPFLDMGLTSASSNIRKWTTATLPPANPPSLTQLQQQQREAQAAAAGFTLGGKGSNSSTAVMNTGLYGSSSLTASGMVGTASSPGAKTSIMKKTNEANGDGSSASPPGQRQGKPPAASTTSNASPVKFVDVSEPTDGDSRNRTNNNTNSPPQLLSPQSSMGSLKSGYVNKKRAATASSRENLVSVPGYARRRKSSTSSLLNFSSTNASGNNNNELSQSRLERMQQVQERLRLKKEKEASKNRQRNAIDVAIAEEREAQCLLATAGKRTSEKLPRKKWLDREAIRFSMNPNKEAAHDRSVRVFKETAQQWSVYGAHK